MEELRRQLEVKNEELQEMRTNIDDHDKWELLRLQAKDDEIADLKKKPARLQEIIRSLLAKITEKNAELNEANKMLSEKAKLIDEGHKMLHEAHKTLEETRENLLTFTHQHEVPSVFQPALWTSNMTSPLCTIVLKV